MTKGPTIDWAGLSPLIALLGGSLIVLMVGLFRSRFARRTLLPTLTIGALGASLGLTIWQWGEQKSIISGALRIDDLALSLNLIFCVAAIAAVLLALRDEAPREAGEGEFASLLLAAAAGMFVLVAAENIVTLWLGLELLSIPLYVLCASEMRRATSLESGLKYLIVGSVGSATMLYGLALVYGATGETNFSGIADALGGSIVDDPLFLTGLALCIVGLAFKASVAPFHQWTPDVYQGAPTPVTAFMAVATKAAAFGVILRFLDVAVIDAQTNWGPALAALATVSIIVGNVGALGQRSLKRMLAYSSVAQAGYLLVGVVVSTKLGLQATVFYLAVYMAMNLAAFAVIIARERESGLGDDLSAFEGLGETRPWLAWPMTIAMLSLAGLPATAGFVGKFYLISAAVDNGYTWLGVVLVIGSMISLAYYLRVISAIWMQAWPGRRPEPATGPTGQPILAGGSPELDLEEPDTHIELALVAIVFAAASIVLGIIPGPLFDLVRDVGASVGIL